MRHDQLAEPRAGGFADVGLKDWVKAARMRARMTQAKLAARLGRTKANVSSWEAGRHRPSIQQAQDIARITGHPFPELGVRQIGSDWLFDLVSRERVLGLSDEELGYVQAAMNGALRDLLLLPVRRS